MTLNGIEQLIGFVALQNFLLLEVYLKSFCNHRLRVSNFLLHFQKFTSKYTMLILIKFYYDE